MIAYCIARKARQQLFLQSGQNNSLRRFADYAI